MELTLKNYQEYLKMYYKNANDRDLFMKLSEEIGELAIALNRKYGLKTGDFSKENLGEELVDIIYFAFAIATSNDIDLEKALLSKDKEGSIRYNRPTNLEEFLKN